MSALHENANPVAGQNQDTVPRNCPFKGGVRLVAYQEAPLHVPRPRTVAAVAGVFQSLCYWRPGPRLQVAARTVRQPWLLRGLPKAALFLATTKATAPREST